MIYLLRYKIKNFSCEAANTRVYVNFRVCKKYNHESLQILGYCGGPAISLQYTVSLVQWVNRLLPIEGVPQCNQVSSVSTASLHW